MKTIDRDFMVRIDGKVFTGNEIYKIEINGTRFNLDCGCKSGTDFKISGNTKNLEFLGNTPTARELEGYEMCGDRGFYGPPHSNPADDIEIVSPLGAMKEAIEDTLKEMGRTPGEIHVGIDLDGKQFAKAIKPGDAMRETIKDVVREVMEENVIEIIRMKKDRLKIDSDDFERLIKKYNLNQGRRSGGD